MNALRLVAWNPRSLSWSGGFPPEYKRIMIKPVLLSLNCMEIGPNLIFYLSVWTHQVALPLVSWQGINTLHSLPRWKNISLPFPYCALRFWEKSSFSGITDIGKEGYKQDRVIDSFCHTQSGFLQTQESIPLWRTLFIHGQQLSETSD